jgi:hypothetical protein
MMNMTGWIQQVVFSEVAFRDSDLNSQKSFGIRPRNGMRRDRKTAVTSRDSRPIQTPLSSCPQRTNSSSW